MNVELLKEIETSIATVGFPIVCVIVLWRKTTISDERQNAILTELIKAINELKETLRRDRIFRSNGKGGEHG